MANRIYFMKFISEVDFSYYWGNRYGSEIAEQLLHKIDNIISVRQVTAITSPNNLSSKKILLKQGFLSQKIYKIDDGYFAEEFIRAK